MDRLIATNSVPLASADTAPDTGTAQYATDGSPANGVPATIFPAYAFNAIQEELIAVIAASGATLDRTNNSQLLSALRTMFSPGIGFSARMTASAAAAATTVTFSDDYVNVAIALNGATYRIPNFSATLNLAKTGIGGMDTGTAAASTWLAVYAAFSPTLLNASLADGNSYATAYAAASGVFATQDTSTAGTLYSGANLPSGYTATARIGYLLVSTTAGQLAATVQVGRAVRTLGSTIVSGSVSATTASFAEVTANVPYGASRLILNMAANVSGSAQGTVSLASTAAGVGSVPLSVNSQTSGGVGVSAGNALIDLITQRTMYYEITTTNASYPVAVTISTTGFEF